MQDVPRPRGAPSPKATPPHATKLMGRFQCEALLHSEGLLETWRGRVQGLGGFDRVFAVKCLVSGALQRRPRAAEDLLRAARAAGAVQDERIAGVLDSGLAPGSAFVATEFVHGVSLRALREYVHGRAAEEGGRPTTWPALIIHLCCEIAGALAAAHGARPPLAHGALAAGSVMVTPQGTIKLVDLGLFASVHMPAEIAASPVRRPCAAPELGKGEAPSPASDMYALGALALELATGRERRASGKLEPGTSWSRVLASELQALVRRLLSFETAERPTADAVETALREAATLVRGIDLRGELGQLVRRVMQSSGADTAQPGDGLDPLQGEAGDGDLSPPFSPAPGTADHPFVDEPTQVLEVSENGHPDKLASILRDLRLEAEEDEGTIIDGGLHPTPPVGTPIVTTLSPAPTDLQLGHGGGVVDPELSAVDQSAETRIQGVPNAQIAAMALTDLAPGPPRLTPTAARLAMPASGHGVAASNGHGATGNGHGRAVAPAAPAAAPAPPPIRLTTPRAQAAAGAPRTPPPPQPRVTPAQALKLPVASIQAASPPVGPVGGLKAVRFEEFATAHPVPGQMTPSGWHPTGDLDGPTETDRRPLSDELLVNGLPPELRGRPRARRPMGKVSKVLLMVAGAVVLGAGLAAAVRFVAGKPPATVLEVSGGAPRPP
jgi:serine/threonine protein kinase